MGNECTPERDGARVQKAIRHSRYTLDMRFGLMACKVRWPVFSRNTGSHFRHSYQKILTEVVFFSIFTPPAVLFNKGGMYIQLVIRPACAFQWQPKRHYDRD